MKTLLSALAMVLTVAAFWPYWHGLWQRRIQAHVFSWLIWASTTLIVFAAQWQAGGGVGALAIGFSGLLTLAILGLAWRRREGLEIRPVDVAFLLAAMGSLPLWFLTRDPLQAVIVLTVVDVLGFGPTLRKVWAQPHSESLLFFGLFLLRKALVLLALEQYSLATMLFPAAVGLACALVIGIMLWRRHGLPLPTAT